jgi:hypothetical protein
MVILGAAGVDVRVGFLVMVGVRVGVRVWSRVGVGELITGTSTTRVTSDVTTRVTSLVISTVWRMGTGAGARMDGAQETPINRIRHAARQGIKNFKRFAPFKTNQYYLYVKADFPADYSLSMPMAVDIL